MSSNRPRGVTLSCSRVPTSFSRTMAIDDRFVVTTNRSSATIPGSMKYRLSRRELNQTLTIGWRPADRAEVRTARARSPQAGRQVCWRRSTDWE